METIKVSSKSNPNNVARALANMLKDKNKISVQVIGAGALNQLIKSIIILRGFFAPLGKNIKCEPSFTEININNSVKTGIKIALFSEPN